MKRRKKFIGSIVLAAFLTLALAACAATETETTQQDVEIAGESLDADGGWALDASDFTGEEFAGDWQDEVSQRAALHIASALEMDELNLSELSELGGAYSDLDAYKGVYSVAVHWGGSYNSATQWRMIAVAGAQDDILYYENGSKVEITFPEDDNAPAQETVIWDNSSGYLRFSDDGYLTWHDEKEPQAEDCRFVKVE